MSGIQAHAFDEIASAVDAPSAARRVAHRVDVEIADPTRLADLQSAWTDLLGRAAEPNVFMDPELIAAAAKAYATTHSRTLLAWKHVSGKRRLVGLWSFVIGRPRRSPLRISVLLAPPYAQSYLATPVIDRTCLDEVLAAMLDSAADDTGLPTIIALDAMAAEGSTMEALTRVLAERGSAPCMLGQFRRPKLASALDGKKYLEAALSSSSRKKLRQHRRRLGETGTLTSVVVSNVEDVRRGIEDFLTIEASGWKGREGTALLCDAGDAAFMRNAVAALAERGRAAIHSLYLDGKPVSMQIVSRSGEAAFTWKTAYDERFQDFSPGTLLLEDYTAAFLADRSIAFVDSCSLDESGFMSAWTERQTVASLWIDARRGGALSFRVLAGLQKLYGALRATAKDAYWKLRRLRKR